MKIRRIAIDNLEKQERPEAKEPVKVPPYFEDTCPVCKSKATGGCRCPMINGKSNDRFCANKHTWYWDKGQVVIGSHH